MHGTMFLYGLGILLNLTLFLSVGFLIYLVILDVVLDYKINVLKDDVDRLKVNLDVIKPLSAVEAVKLTHESVSQEGVDKLLKSVFKRIDKEASKGLSQVVLSKKDWYNQDKMLYKKSVNKLRRLGYNVRFDCNYRIVIVSW